MCSGRGRCEERHNKIIASTLAAFAPPFRGEYNDAMQIDPQARALFPRIYDVVRQVPRGKVTTYGDVAQLIGPGCDARLVGYAMANCPDDAPWQRVINSQGKISLQGEVRPETADAPGSRRDRV